MSTLAEMRTEVRNIINEPDSANSHFTDAQIDIWINEGYRYILTRLGVIPIKERTYTSAAPVSGQSTISLNVRTLTIDEVYMDTLPGDKLTRLDIITLQDLASIDNQWIDADRGIPIYFIRKDTFTALLYPPPNTDNVSRNVITHGMEFPADLTSSDSPSLPLNLHDVMQHFGAYRAWQQLNRQDLATNELILVNGQLKAQNSISTRFSQQRMRWLWHED